MNAQSEKALRSIELLVKNRLKEKRGLTDQDLAETYWREKVREIAIVVAKEGAQAMSRYEDE